MHEISIVSQAVLKENLNCEKKNGLRLFDSSRDDCFNGEDGVAGENFEDRMTSLPQASIINNSSGNSDGNLTNNNSLKMTNNNTNSSNNIGVDANGSSFLTTTTTSTDSAATTNAITSTTAASATTATVLTPAPQLAQSKLPAIDHSINGNCCAGCKESIKDKFLFKVIDMNFHQECVQCSDCSKRLNEKCFTYQGKLYCKFDYLRRFGPKCSSCNELIERSELVQRIEKENLIYHLKCFNCNDCQRQLRQGEQMHLLISPAGKRLLLCKQDFSKQQQYSSALNNSSDNNRATIGAKLEQQQQQRAYYAIGNNQAVKQESAAHELSRMKLGRASATAGQQGDSSLDGIEDSLEQEELDGDELEELDEDEEGEEVSGDDEELNGDDSNQLDTMRRILDSTNYLMSANEEHFRDDKLDDFEENEENHSGVSNNNNGAIGKKGTGKLAIGGKLKRKRRRQKQRDSCGVLTQGSKKLTHNNIGESILNGSATAANLPGSSSILASNSTIMSPATGGQLGGAGSPVGSFQQHQASSKQLAINGSNHSLSNQSSSNHSSNSSASSAISQNQSEIPANAHNHHQHQHHNHNNAHLQHHSHQHRNHHQQQTGGHKPTRVRTVLNEKQLQTLRDCYAHNPRPDALMKEQLVDLTGLSPRVIRVWFQNKRCKDKKKTILCKQMLQHEKDGRHFNGMTVLHGVQLVASSPIQYQEEQSTVSPVSQGLAPASTASATTAPGPNAAPQAMTTNSSSTNNSGNVLEPLTTSPGAPLNQSLVEMGQAYAREGPGSPRAEIHAYQPPWKELIDYAHSHASAPINNNHPATSGQNAPTQPTPSDRLNAASPRYRQLMGQIHGYSTSANETMALGNDNLAIQQQFSQTNYQQQQQQAQGADLMHNHPGNFNQVPPAQPHHLSHQFQR